AFSAVRISSLPAAGTLKLSGVAVTVSQVIPVASLGSLVYAPAANANGAAYAAFDVRVQDDGGTANGGVDTSAIQTFTITVTAVNDVPSFAKGANVTVLEDATAYSAAAWAGSISAGPTDEAGQALNFIVSNNNNGL